MATSFSCSFPSRIEVSPPSNIQRLYKSRFLISISCSFVSNLSSWTWWPQSSEFYMFIRSLDIIQLYFACMYIHIAKIYKFGFVNVNTYILFIMCINMISIDLLYCVHAQYISKRMHAYMHH